MNKLLYFLLLSMISLQAASQTLAPVNEGSKVHFTIKNFGFNTGGDFGGLSGTILFDPEFPNASKFDVSINAATIDTENESRDKDLRGKIYFDVETYPAIRMVSTKIDKTNKSDDGFYYFTGLLIMKGTSKVISFPFEAKKINAGYQFSGEFTINRLDFDVGEKSTVLGKTVTVSLQVIAKNK